MDWKSLVGFTVLFHGILYAWKRQFILRMDTTKLNSFINGMGQSRMRKYFRLWFRLGSYVTIIIGFPFTVWLFLRTIFIALTPSVVTVAAAVTPSSLLASTELVHGHAIELHHEQLSPYPDAEIPISVSSSKSYLAIQPILPGWNLPLSHLPYYLIAILISVVIHEMGHAIASASHRIPISSMGVSLFGPLIPTAHVELNSTQLRDAPFKKQMDILTAGVWMNLYLALITYFVVPKLLPAILFPTHGMGTGLVVTGVMERSGAGGPSGLQRGDVIIGIEHCHVEDLNSWLSCLENIWESEPVGYCLNSENVAKYANNSKSPACCVPDGDTSATHLCFMQMDSGGQTLLQEVHHLESSVNDSLILQSVGTDLDKPVLVTSNQSDNSSFHPQPQPISYCLPAKPVVTENGTSSLRCFAPKYFCHFNSDMLEESDDSEQNHLQAHCFLPRIVKQYGTFRTVQIHRRQSGRKESVLFVGDVRDLASGVSTSEYIPRDWFGSRLFGFSKFSVIPVELETVLLLTAGLSAGLAVVNMLPIYGLDGYHVVDAIIRVVAGKRWESRKISRLVNIISWVALGIALLTVFCSIFQSF